ncbi:hypothetical protein GCM10028808_74710 [Spirosoma migulaei]
MKQHVKTIAIILSMFHCLSSLAQDTLNQIDPRQYVTIQYRKVLTRDRSDTLWNWEHRKGIPNQKVHYIDINGEIRIDFSRLGLSQNKEFEGVVSLEAEISGSNGTRKIEVNPYSEIGVQRIPIGIKSEPPSEIAKKLLNMLLSVRDADTLNYKFNGYQQFDIATLNLRKNVDTRLKEFNAEKVEKEIRNKGYELSLLIRNSPFRSSMERPISVNFFFDPNIKIEEIKDYVTKITSDFNTIYKSFSSGYIRDLNAALEYNIDRTNLILDYLASFENAGEDATKAFFLLLNKDLVSYKALKASFVNNQKKLSQINTNYRPDDPRLDSTLLYNANLIVSSTKVFSELSNFRGSALEKILINMMKQNPYIYNEPAGLRIKYNEKIVEKFMFLDYISTYFQNISEKISEVAGKSIYKKLIYATIDLGKSGAKDGEVMNIYLTWILDSKKDSLANSPRLSIGKYFLRQTGWQVSVSDMFSMVKRINEQNTNLTSTSISPSNFKGSGGAVLMWTYNKEDKGLTIDSNKRGEQRIRRKNKFSNFLEPSLGINISYLDFSIEKDVEIGTGAQLGLFRNKIFLGYGVNLHMISPTNQSPTYFFIGFSFAKLSDLFKNSSSVSSQQ